MVPPAFIAVEMASLAIPEADICRVSYPTTPCARGASAVDGDEAHSAAEADSHSRPCMSARRGFPLSRHNGLRCGSTVALVGPASKYGQRGNPLQFRTLSEFHLRTQACGTFYEFRPDGEQAPDQTRVLSSGFPHCEERAGTA
jgi:hypothetical protein